MNHVKHVISEKVFTYVNLLLKIFRRKNKSECNNGFHLNLSMVTV
jgi:hypothetical protein